MEITKIEDTDHEDFNESWEIYEYSFPTDERRGIEKQKEVLNQEEYSFSSIKDEDTVTGMIATWDFDTISFIEHIAIKKECRGKGIGTKIMKEHCEKNNKKVILEVERPEDDISKKRIEFYKKLGFTLNEFDYLQPAYEEGKKPVPLFIMSFPEELSFEEYQGIKRNLYEKVYKVKGENANIKIILINPEGKILLLHRDNIPGIGSPNKWSFVGGILEEGETPEQCIIRETKEEINFDVKEMSLFKEYNNPEIKRYVFVGKIDKEISELTLTEGQDFNFFTVEEALKLDLSNHTRKYIEDYFMKK